MSVIQIVTQTTITCVWWTFPLTAWIVNDVFFFRLVFVILGYGKLREKTGRSKGGPAVGSGGG